MTKLSFIASDDRFYNVSRALSLIKTDITSAISGAKNVVIKTNCYCNNYQLSATHLDSLDALLEFISPYVNCQIILAESCSEGNALAAFHNYNYFDIQEKYDLALVDLQKDQQQQISLYDEKSYNHRTSLPKTLLESDFIISITPPKTHAIYNYFGAISNMLPSHLDPTTQNQKSFAKTLGLNKKSAPSNAILEQNNTFLSHLYRKLPASLCIIDGYASMQGNGPGSEGELAATHWSIASKSSPVADLFSSTLLGFDINKIPYLSNLLDNNSLDNSIIVGDEWKKYINNIKKHQNFSEI